MKNKPRFFNSLSVLSSFLFLIVVLAPVYACYSTKGSVEKFEGYKTLMSLNDYSSSYNAIVIFIIAILIAILVLALWEIICVIMKFKLSLIFSFAKILLALFLAIIGFVANLALFSGICLGIMVVLSVVLFFQYRNQE